MRKIYFLFFLFTAITTTYGQTEKKENTAAFSLNQLLENVNSISKDDSLLYKKALNLYVEKAKKTQSYEHLFNAYLFYVFYGHTANVMHQYTDTIHQLAIKTQQPLNIIKAHQTRSTVYYIQKNYKKSLEHELTALQLIDKSTNAYEYYKTLYSIGLTYFYLQQYKESANYFHTARVYFEDKPLYNDLRGYMNSIRYEALSATFVANYQLSNELIKKGSSKLSQIKEYTRPLEKAYLNYVHGINLYHLKNYKESVTILKSTLAEIIKNEDYANEANVYYYIGQNLRAQGLRLEAMTYFDRIDQVFNEKHYSNLEVKNAYTHLITHYSELKDEKKQLYYTNQLLRVSEFLQKEYRHLSSSLHKKMDIKHLQAEKQRLEKSLHTKDLVLYTFITAGIALFIIVTYLLLHNYRKKKEYLKRYTELNNQKQSIRTPSHTDSEFREEEIYSALERDNSLQELPFSKQNGESLEREVGRSHENTSKPNKLASDKTVNDLLKHLQVFEDSYEFLEKDISLTQLATRWNTNRSYLSTLINQYKGKSFTDYVNQLRVDYVLQKLDNEPVWRAYKISHISEKIGFSSSRSFSNAFLKVTGISPSFYLQKLKNDGILFDKI